jgi:hypothetical protein
VLEYSISSSFDRRGTFSERQRLPLQIVKGIVTASVGGKRLVSLVLKDHLALADVNPFNVQGRLTEAQAGRPFTQVMSSPKVGHSDRHVTRRNFEAEII